MSSEHQSRSSVGRFIASNWYRRPIANFWLLPLHGLFWIVVLLRRFWFAIFPPMASKAPVIVVGNITVGGTGKTPLITWLAQRAVELDMSVGIVSRGYGGRSEHYPLEVTSSISPAECGDEPWLLHNRLGCRVVVAPKRADAVSALGSDVDLILSDDGMQHYAMPRVAEILVVDGERGFGNGWLMPVGPLREPKTRVDSVDCVVVNGSDFILQPQQLVNASTGEVVDLLVLEGHKVHAVAGIGHPARFFKTLEKLGMDVEPHAFEDHHPFDKADIEFGDDLPIVMTEKDWVKCRDFVTERCWYLPVDAVPTRKTRQALDTMLLTWGEKKRG
ncbi:MAG: tetraacyldisaccharide 4'-kinase [Oceanospirillaceae bacterium]|nr:tetraacyldisaccharide 4'-kinase [Oceanospirillaceae bacterium]